MDNNKKLASNLAAKLEAKREYYKKRYSTDPEFRERERVRKRASYAKRKQDINKKRRKKYRDLPSDVRQAWSKTVSQERKDKRQTVPGYRRAYNAWQRAYRSLRLPPWVKMDDFIEFYAKVDELCAKGEDVVGDHVIPYRGEKVCGLHVPENLQILSRQKNGEKKNDYEPGDE